MTLYEPSLHHANSHGIIVGVAIPDAPEPVPSEVLDRLPEAERTRALSLGGYRQVQFVGGRIAMRAARRQLGAPLDPVLPDERGTPILPPGIAGSISHKRNLAVALVAPSRGGATMGVDIEEHAPERMRIADRILRPEELELVYGLPEERRWIATVVRFSIKESIYKAIDPWVRRYVDFHEASVMLDPSGRADITMHLQGGEGPFEIDARYEWWRGRVLSTVALRPVAQR